MTFKEKWEKTHTQFNLPEGLIEQMLAQVLPGDEVSNYHIIEGGCANINVKVQLVNQSAPKILRVYIREPEAAFREQKIAQLLQEVVPVPLVYRVAELQSYTFSLVEYIDGITLRKLLLSDKPYDLNKIMIQVGKLLAAISTFYFEQSGFFDHNR